MAATHVRTRPGNRPGVPTYAPRVWAITPFLHLATAKHIQTLLLLGMKLFLSARRVIIVAMRIGPRKDAATPLRTGFNYKILAKAVAAVNQLALLDHPPIHRRLLQLLLLPHP